MEIRVTFPGGKKVNAEVAGFTVQTDQPQNSGGEETAPSPFKLFLASVATCSGIYIVDFCNRRGISLDDIELIQKTEFDRETNRLVKMTHEIALPKDFPDKYHEPLLRAVNLCAVKKVIENPPEMLLELRVKED